MFTNRDLAFATLLILALSACSADQPTGPARPDIDPAASAAPSLPEVVRQLAAARGIGELGRPMPIRPALVALGQALVFDKLLSGNRDISCMTCHLPQLATGDGRSLSIGQGASGLGLNRLHPRGAFIPRNAPPLFNLGALESLFWDGRVSMDASGKVHTPAGTQITPAMEGVFEFGALSALGMFPVMSRSEMRGEDGNELAAIPDQSMQDIWRALMNRLGQVAEYRQTFRAAYPGTPFDAMTFAHASNAMAAFMLDRLTFNNSPWDRFLGGSDAALTDAQLAGARTFLSIRCSLCHNGAAFTDNAFHNVAVAQFGPGQGDGPSGHDDFGRMRVTGNASDRYRFRTTPLRNVLLTGPYGHDGAIADLRQFIDHYSESHLKLQNFDPSTLEALLQGTMVANVDAILATRDTILDGVVLPPIIVDQLTAFMVALTDPDARELGRLVPARVPSGLPVDGRR
jgi:cytochrome c peroxidase